MCAIWANVGYDRAQGVGKVMAGELAAANGDHRAAFARYEQEMRAYVTRCQKFAQGGKTFLLPKSRAQIWARNQFMRLLPYMPWRGLMDVGIQKTANAVRLNDYGACRRAETPGSPAPHPPAAMATS